MLKVSDLFVGVVRWLSLFLNWLWASQFSSKKQAVFGCVYRFLYLVGHIHIVTFWMLCKTWRSQVNPSFVQTWPHFIWCGYSHYIYVWTYSCKQFCMRGCASPWSLSWIFESACLTLGGTFFQSASHKCAWVELHSPLRWRGGLIWVSFSLACLSFLMIWNQIDNVVFHRC